MLPIEQIKKIEIELSSYCNARCPLCDRQYLGTDIERSDFNKGHLSFDNVKALIEQLPNPKDVVLYFAGVGGDPMMNPEIVEIFEYCSKKMKWEVLELPRILSFSYYTPLTDPTRSG